MTTSNPKHNLQKLIKSKDRIALIADNKVIEFIVTPKNHLSFGTILTARITTKIPGAGAYFVMLPNNQTGFLQTKAKIDNGTKILAIVTKEAHGKKYAKISTTLPKMGAEYMENFTREAQNSKSPAILYIPDIIAELQKIYDITTIITDDMPGIQDPFVTEGIDDEFALAQEPLVITNEGIHIFIEKTEAFCAIDVDAGSADNLSSTEINLVAVKAIAQHIRQRNIGGQIVIDFISSPKNPLNGRVVESLKELVSYDPTPTNVIGVTPLGHVELVRRSSRISLAEGVAIQKKDY